MPLRWTLLKTHGAHAKLFRDNCHVSFRNKMLCCTMLEIFIRILHDCPSQMKFSQYRNSTIYMMKYLLGIHNNFEATFILRIFVCEIRIKRTCSVSKYGGIIEKLDEFVLNIHGDPLWSHHGLFLAIRAIPTIYHALPWFSGQSW